MKVRNENPFKQLGGRPNKLSCAVRRRGTKSYNDSFKGFRIPKRVKNWSPMKEAKMLQVARRDRPAKRCQTHCIAALNYFGEFYASY